MCLPQSRKAIWRMPILPDFRQIYLFDVVYVLFGIYWSKWNVRVGDAGVFFVHSSGRVRARYTNIAYARMVNYMRSRNMSFTMGPLTALLPKHPASMIRHNT